ncbi:hypothetical protein G9P44_003830 [Scheffersomyces stipitis]|nr:hypothetical protein G9P44_003830 [Scheffersomyces stipitis]
MSADKQSLPTGTGTGSATGAGSGIRLPSISFLSGPSGSSKLPPAANMGISSFLNNTSAPDPSSQIQPKAKRVKHEQPETQTQVQPSEDQSQAQAQLQTHSQAIAQSSQNQYGTYSHDYNSGYPQPEHTKTYRPIEQEPTQTQKAQLQQTQIQPQFQPHQNPQAQTQTQSKASQTSSTNATNAPSPPAIPTETNKQYADQDPHRHHHHHHHHHHHPHHHHHHHHSHPQPGSEQSGIPHIHSGNHIHVLAPESVKQEGVAKPNDDVDITNPVQHLEDTESEQQTAADILEATKDVESAKSLLPPQRALREKVEFNTVPPVSLNVQPVLQFIKEKFPQRRHLGTIVYNPTTTWSNLQTSQLYGLKPGHVEEFDILKERYESKSKEVCFQKKYIPSLPPLTADYINSIVEIKIPFHFIDKFIHEFESSVIIKRELWGGASGAYTDDSDILSILAHNGFFHDKMDLTQWNPNWTRNDIIKPLNINVNVDSKAPPSEQDSDEHAEIYGDLSVELLLLPPLPEYHGFYANGINSRSWTSANKHNGLSIAVYNVKWESFGAHLRSRLISKRSASELAKDSNDNAKVLNGKRGWSFDYAYYKQLKNKFAALDTEAKNSTVETNGGKVVAANSVS